MLFLQELLESGEVGGWLELCTFVVCVLIYKVDRNT